MTDFNALQANTFALNHELDWFDFVRRDTTLFYTFLSIIGTRYEVAARNECDSQSQYFRSLAIRHINKRLAEEDHSRLPAEIIGAVSCLLLKEVRNVEIIDDIFMISVTLGY